MWCVSVCVASVSVWSVSVCGECQCVAGVSMCGRCQYVWPVSVYDGCHYVGCVTLMTSPLVNMFTNDVIRAMQFFFKFNGGHLYFSIPIIGLRHDYKSLKSDMGASSQQWEHPLR